MYSSIIFCIAVLSSVSILSGLIMKLYKIDLEEFKLFSNSFTMKNEKNDVMYFYWYRGEFICVETDCNGKHLTSNTIENKDRLEQFLSRKLSMNNYVIV